jgi:hypothetical protein
VCLGFRNRFKVVRTIDDTNEQIFLLLQIYISYRRAVNTKPYPIRAGDSTTEMHVTQVASSQICAIGIAAYSTSGTTIPRQDVERSMSRASFDNLRRQLQLLELIVSLQQHPTSAKMRVLTKNSTIETLD